MRLIPVVDLMHGRVVRAVRGERNGYQPMHSQLAAGSEPLALARALLARTGSEVLYIADLDALRGGALQRQLLGELLGALRSAQPGLRLWLDGGWPDLDAARRELAAIRFGDAIDPVLGSESLRDAAALRDWHRQREPVDPVAPADPVDPDRDLARRAILSLDRRDGQRLDAAGCWQQPQHWPARVIVMTLERVGAGSGPDLETLAAVRAAASAQPATALIGAGGVRDDADLTAAAAAGAHAWLVASALHDGRLARVDRVAHVAHVAPPPAPAAAAHPPGAA